MGMNLHSIVNRYIQVVNANFTGSWLSSQGYTQEGDAQFTGSIAGDVLTVSAIASGVLAVGSLLTDTDFELLFGTTIMGLGTGAGGLGTYIVSHSQTVASEAMSANGGGQRTGGYTTFPGLGMQVQAVSGDDLKHIEGLNIQGTMRAIWMNGIPQGVQRPDVKGGDLLQIPTGLTAAPFDTYLVAKCIENWDASGWSHVIGVLQQAVASQ